MALSLEKKLMKPMATLAIQVAEGVQYGHKSAVSLDVTSQVSCPDVCITVLIQCVISIGRWGGTDGCDGGTVLVICHDERSRGATDLQRDRDRQLTRGCACNIIMVPVALSQ